MAGGRVVFGQPEGEDDAAGAVGGMVVEDEQFVVRVILREQGGRRTGVMRCASSRAGTRTETSGVSLRGEPPRSGRRRGGEETQIDQRLREDQPERAEDGDMIEQRRVHPLLGQRAGRGQEWPSP